MSTVNRNIKAMDVPSFAYTDRHDGRVFIYSLDDKGEKRKKTIGYMTDSTPGHERMIPNAYFKLTYQNLYREAYPDEKIPFHEIYVGMYATLLGIGTKLGIYAELQEVYGMLFANAIMDYVMFCIVYRSSVTQIFSVVMERNVLFSDRLYSDSWYSTFFSKKLTEDQHHQFRIHWVKHLIKCGLKKVWLCLDGSNNDCAAKESELPQFGHAKSHNANKTIVGYMYAVDAETGKPVTYFVYEGSIPDSQAFAKVSTFLGGFSLEIEGVILDRGFAADGVFEIIEDHHWKYVIMLPGDTYGHMQMTMKYAETIRWKSQYLLKNTTLFGVRDSMKLFGNRSRTSNICLFFDGAGNSLQSTRLIKKIQAAWKKAEESIANGKRASIDKALQKYIHIDGEGPKRKVIPNYDEWDKSMAFKGFYSMAVSDGITPDEANRLYMMRDASETQFSILKSQEGGDTTRVHKTAGIQSKFAITFIASVFRHEIEAASQRLNLDTSVIIQSISRVSLMYAPDGNYESTRNLSTIHRTFLQEFDISQDDIGSIAREYNGRSRKDSKNPDRKLPTERMPLIKENSHKKGKKPAEAKDPSASDNEKQDEIPEQQTDESAKSKGGRPKGKKDSKPRKSRSDKGKPRASKKKN